MYCTCSGSAFASQWRKAPRQSDLQPRIFRLPSNSEVFSAYYDRVQADLQTMSGMDELLAGETILGAKWNRSGA